MSTLHFPWWAWAAGIAGDLALCWFGFWRLVRFLDRRFEAMLERELNIWRRLNLWERR